VNIFVVIEYTYRKTIPYKIPNIIGKMTTKIYTKNILPQLMEDFQDQGLILCQDADLAHKNNGIIAWAEKNRLPLITLPGVFPDLSIMESIARPLKKDFYTRRSPNQETGLARIIQLFKKEIDQEIIQYMYNKIY
jgi:hypothetical protein